MNQHYLGEGSHNIHLDEELNVDATKFLELLKVVMYHYKMRVQLIVNY